MIKVRLFVRNNHVSWSPRVISTEPRVSTENGLRNTVFEFHPFATTSWRSREYSITRRHTTAKSVFRQHVFNINDWLHRRHLQWTRWKHKVIINRQQNLRVSFESSCKRKNCRIANRSNRAVLFETNARALKTRHGRLLSLGRNRGSASSHRSALHLSRTTTDRRGTPARATVSWRESSVRCYRSPSVSRKVCSARSRVTQTILLDRRRCMISSKKIRVQIISSGVLRFR